MDYHRILTIQDISCVGQCSMTVALPILSACGIETCILPSAVLSTHTGGFTGFTFRDLTEDIPAIRRHWEREGIRFEAIYTGYLGSTAQIDYVNEIFDSCLTPGGKLIVDPAMADNGKLYTGFDAAYVEAMKKLVARADYCLPNATEACFLTGEAYRPEFSEAEQRALLKKVSALGHGITVLTGAAFADGTTGVMAGNGDTVAEYRHRKIPRSFHGTGDVFSSAFTGALISGKPLMEAAVLAADFTADSIALTAADEAHWYGVKFEQLLPRLSAGVFGA